MWRRKNGTNKVVRKKLWVTNGILHTIDGRQKIKNCQEKRGEQ